MNVFIRDKQFFLSIPNHSIFQTRIVQNYYYSKQRKAGQITTQTNLEFNENSKINISVQVLRQLTLIIKTGSEIKMNRRVNKQV